MRLRMHIATEVGGVDLDVTCVRRQKHVADGWSSSVQLVVFLAPTGSKQAINEQARTT